MNFQGRKQVVAELNLRPQDRFKNPNGYDLAQENDTLYCSFKIDAPKFSGVYRVIVDGQIMYVGRAQSLRNRLSQQYGRVSPRHPYKGGQIQKCRTNAKINKALSDGSVVIFEWMVCEDYVEKEKFLLSDVATRPIWNLRS